MQIEAINRRGRVVIWDNGFVSKLYPDDEQGGFFTTETPDGKWTYAFYKDFEQVSTH